MAVPVPVLDGLLLRLAAEDLALYRCWRKGMTLSALPGIDRPDAARHAAGGVDPRPRMRRKLDQMLAYATLGGRPARDSQGRPACRRAIILRYFGEEPIAPRCGACDLCCPDAAYPWSTLSARDVAGVADFFDPAFTVLETVAWNDGRAALGRAPFGLGTLKNALLGNAWQLTRHEADPHRRRARLATLRGCPYWGVFEAMHRGPDRIDEVVARLTAGGFLATCTHDSPTGTPYSAPTLTEAGHARIQAGETFGW